MIPKQTQTYLYKGEMMKDSKQGAIIQGDVEE